MRETNRVDTVFTGQRLRFFWGLPRTRINACSAHARRFTTVGGESIGFPWHEEKLLSDLSGGSRRTTTTVHRTNKPIPANVVAVENGRKSGYSRELFLCAVRL
jgi:hypothetical protein